MSRNCNNKPIKEKPISIGGQAVMEGVMMRSKSSMAMAVRDQDGIIRVESKRTAKKGKKNRIFAFPIIRGIVSFVQSLIDGTKVLMRSAEVYGEGEPSKAEQWLAKKFKINVMSVVITISLLVALALAVFLFMWLPQFSRGLIESWTGFKFNVLARNLIEGGLKILIFLSYLLLCSLIKDVRRTFMYHGAEHKTIACFESGLELTTENAKKCSRVHDRCGTTFMVFVILISILVFAGLEALIGVELHKAVRILIKIASLPIVAGLSYELLKALAKTKCFLVYPLKVPGLLLQRITTRNPNDDMIEVAITAFKTVMEMDNDPTIKEKTFVLQRKRKELLEDVKKVLKENGIEEDAEAEWIVSLTLGVKRDELVSDKIVSAKNIDKINKIVEDRITGRPLWYCIGDTDFYGYTIKVDERVLIPRPETELLVENALKHIRIQSKVLDLCTGSGAIAVAIKKESNAEVYAIDYSKDALDVAKENAKNNQAEVTFIESDLFNSLNDMKFDVIISNPPYIPSEDISTLQTEVKDFEPLMSLDGGSDGLDFYKRIALDCSKFLNENGVILLECGIGQAQSVAKMFDGFKSVEIIKDYENIDRIVKAVL